MHSIEILCWMSPIYIVLFYHLGLSYMEVYPTLVQYQKQNANIKLSRYCNEYKKKCCHIRKKSCYNIHEIFVRNRHILANFGTKYIAFCLRNVYHKWNISWPIISLLPNFSFIAFTGFLAGCLINVIVFVETSKIYSFCCSLYHSYCIFIFNLTIYLHIITFRNTCSFFYLRLHYS